MGAIKGFLLTIGICVVLVLLWVAGRAWYVAEYAADQGTKVIEKTLDADSVVYNYEYFKQAKEDILAMDKKIETAKLAVEDFAKSAGPREKWDFRDKEEASRLSTNLVGLQNVREDMKATYNARMKMANRALFKGDAPLEIQ